MNVIVQSKTLVITAAIRRFAEQQASRFARRTNRISQITVFLEQVKRRKNDTNAATAKFFIDLPGKNIVVQEKAKDLYFAIAEAARRTMRQLGKAKEKRARRTAVRWLPIEAT